MNVLYLFAALRVLGDELDGINFAHDVALSGSNGALVGFLMYPRAETTEGRLDSLDPNNFKYEITRETTSTNG